MNFYITEATAKQLKEWGCKIGSKKDWVSGKCGTLGEGIFALRESYCRGDILIYPAYHLLEDICVKHAKEFFPMDVRAPFHAPTHHPQNILFMIQQDKKEEAEQYILAKCIFNPKNK